MRRREFTKPYEELETIAVDRASRMVLRVFAVLEKSGHAPYVSLEGSAGAAGLLAIAHAAYKEALVEVETEHEKFEAGFEGGHLVASSYSSYVPSPESVARYQARLSRLRSVPVEPLDFDEAAVAVGADLGGYHADGTVCTCPPECDCHPPTRDEDPIVTGERGSWHLDTCPASPKNRGKGAS